MSKIRHVWHFVLVVCVSVLALGAGSGFSAPHEAQAEMGPGLSQPPYQDDRSNPYALMESWANALNRREYLRAYSYWEPGAVQLHSYNVFEQGYANTRYVQLTIGAITYGVGAGNVYYSVPATLVVQTNSGATQTFVGCYQLHLGQPANQETPPFQGLAIQSASVRQVSNGANTAFLMAQACTVTGSQPYSRSPAANESDVSEDRYLDNRSTAREVMRSYINAINRHEYLRAFSYWDSQNMQLPSFQTYQQGYADTQSVQLAFGAVTSRAGAGQLYYSVPLTYVAHTSGGGMRYYVGCYVLHLAQPATQGVPPFQPLAILSAVVRQVSSSPDVSQASRYCP